MCVFSDGSGSFDWMAHDPEKDLCAGPQLSSPHHCPHHQSSCAALYGVSQHFREHCPGHKGCLSARLLFNSHVLNSAKTICFPKKVRREECQSRTLLFFLNL